MTNVDYHEYTVDKLLEFLPKHLAERKTHLYLDSSIEIVNRYEPAVKGFFADEDLARKTLVKVIGHARLGIPTETVVKKFRTEDWMKEEFARVLEEQTNLSFL